MKVHWHGALVHHLAQGQVSTVVQLSLMVDRLLQEMTLTGRRILIQTIVKSSHSISSIPSLRAASSLTTRYTSFAFLIVIVWL